MFEVKRKSSALAGIAPWVLCHGGKMAHFLAAGASLQQPPPRRRISLDLTLFHNITSHPPAFDISTRLSLKGCGGFFCHFRCLEPKKSLGFLFLSIISMQGVQSITIHPRNHPAPTLPRSNQTELAPVACIHKRIQATKMSD